MHFINQINKFVALGLNLPSSPPSPSFNIVFFFLEQCSHYKMLHLIINRYPLTKLATMSSSIEVPSHLGKIIKSTISSASYPLSIQELQKIITAPNTLFQNTTRAGSRNTILVMRMQKSRLL